MDLLSLTTPFRYCGDRKEAITHAGFDSWMGRGGHEVWLLFCTQTMQELPGKVTFHPSPHTDRLHDSKHWASSAYICI